MKQILIPVLLALPAAAAFKSTTQIVPLQFGQQQATIVFETTGEKIEDATPHCDCTSVKLNKTTLTAVVDTRTFDRNVEKTIAAETENGEEVTLCMQFRVPQAILLSARSLTWKRNAAPTPQVLRITLPQGSPITHIANASLSGETFDYVPRVIKRGREYTVAITPRSTAKASLNRLVLTTNSPDPRYRQHIIYLQVKK